MPNLCQRFDVLHEEQRFERQLRWLESTEQRRQLLVYVAKTLGQCVVGWRPQTSIFDQFHCGVLNVDHAPTHNGEAWIDAHNAHHAADIFSMTSCEMSKLAVAVVTSSCSSSCVIKS